MMTAAQYVSLIVEPTLEEFRQNVDDLRRGMLASMAVLHVVDFVMQNREATPKAGDDAVAAFKKRMAGVQWGFDTVNLFALASKHGALRNPQGFDIGKHMVAAPAFADVMVIDGSFLGDEIGGITVEVEPTVYVNLLEALDATMALYRAEFSEALEASQSTTP